MKLVVPEAETDALRRYLREERPRALTSALSRVEVARALHRIGAAGRLMRRTDAVFDRLSVLRVEGTALATAAEIGPSSLRTLEAIHLATAMSLAPEPAGVCSYDDRLARAARLAGLPVVSPR